MHQAEYDALSARERECLRLIGEHLQVKEAAAHLGISPKTVETHLANARLKLGGQTSRAAARALIAFEAAQGSSPRASAPMPTTVTYEHPWPIDNAADALASVVREPPQRPWPLPDDEPPARPKGRSNDLGKLARLGLIIAIPIMLAFLVMLAWGVAESMHKTVQAVYPDPTRERNDAQATNDGR